MFYTRKGDDGTSGLFNFKDRFQKDSPIYDALGSVDELNSLLGVLRARTSSVKTLSVSNELFTIQNCLFIVQAELAGADKKLSKRNVEDLETTIGRIEFYIENPNSFIVPGATVESALYDYARSVARRAECAIISLKSQKELSPETYAYINRLSSFLYALARLSTFESGKQESKPTY